MTSGFERAPGERVVFASKRGGVSGAERFAAMPPILAFGAALAASAALASSDAPALALLPPAAFAALMIAARRLAAAPVFCVTDRRLVAERVLRAPLEIELDRIASATCLVAPPARGASAGVETNVVEVTCKDGATYSIGPVVEAGELCAILTSVGQGVADVRALPGAHGEPARAELRDDVFFARSSRSSGAPSGPVFLGPSALVGLASRLVGPPLYLALSVAGQAQPASEVERRMIDLARRETCGPAVVVLREGAALHVEGDALVVDGPSGRVSFALEPPDAERARRFTRTATAYRG